MGQKTNTLRVMNVSTCVPLSADGRKILVAQPDGNYPSRTKFRLTIAA